MEESGASGHGTVGRKHDGCTDIRNRVNGTSTDSTSGMPLGSEPMIRGTGCVNRARPDLWEPWAGNRPGPPGRCIVRVEGYVHASAGYRGHPQVINEASELINEVFKEQGRHTRLALGINEMPLDAAVQLSVWAEVAD